MRNDDGDEEKAIAAYEKALLTNAPPAETDRALGLLWMKRGEKSKARSAFRRYLERQPKADDRGMIESYIGRLE